MAPNNTVRFSFEKIIMGRYFPQFWFNQIGNSCYFQGWHTTSTGGNVYQIKIEMSAWYPDQMPSMYLTFPLILRKFGGGLVDESSHAFHTRSYGPGGCAQICHFDPSRWDASKTCVGVATKGVLWCEAYDAHLATGMTIAAILEEWRKRQIGMNFSEILDHLKRR